MHKKFFLVCAGICLLALSFHLGATNARGQSGPGWFIEGTSYGSMYVLTSSGEWWRYIPGLGWRNDVGNVFGSTTGRTLVAVLPGVGLTSNGEVWFGGDQGGTWQNAGSPPLGPTPLVQQTWGSVKARYR